MKINRLENTTRNIFFGSILRIYQMLMPFIMRTILIYMLGVNYLGLNSLFTSILQVLNLAEMGVGLAMVFSMYEPIAKDDNKKVCALMNLYKNYYRFIGLIVLIGGFCVIPFLNNFIKSDIPNNINIYWLYLLNLLATVSTYWMFAYKNSLLFAHQRTDVSTKISILTDTLKYLLQIGSLVIFKNYYLYTLVIIFTQIITNVITAKITTKLYPQYHAEGALSKEEIHIINKKIRDLFTSKLGYVVFNSVDTIVISSFLGLKILAIYQNYYFIVTSVTSLVGVIFSASVAGIGNSLITETKEKNYLDFKKFTLIVTWVSGFCVVCLSCLYQPFMKIWVTEKLMLPYFAVILFVIYFFVNELTLLLDSYKDAAGMWHEDRFRPLILSFINLSLNVFLVKRVGVYGVLIASCFTKIFIGIPWVLYNLFHYIFNRSAIDYLKKLFIDCNVVVIVTVITYYICKFVTFDGFIGLLFKLMLCILISNVLFYILFKFDKEYDECINMIKRLIRKFMISIRVS